MSKSIRPTLTESEAETLKAALDFVCEQLDEDIGIVSVTYPVRRFALKFCRRRVGNLRAKKFPSKETQK